MTPVCGIVVAVALLAVAMTTVFGADEVCFLKSRTKKGKGEGVSTVMGALVKRVKGIK